MTQDCKRDANPAHFSLGVLFNAPKNHLRTKYVTAAILITALVAPALLPGGIQTAQADCLADETAQFEAGAGRPPSPTAKDAVGWTDLHYVAALNFVSLAKELLQSDAKETRKLKFDRKLLTYELKAILRQFGKDYFDWNKDGETPLHIASKENAHGTVALLIEKDADVNAETDDKRTPPHIAVQENARDTTVLLIEKGAEVDAKDNDENTPLAVELEYRADEIITLLRFATEVGRPPSPTAEDANGWTDLHYAAALNSTPLAKWLLQFDAGVNARLKLDGEPFTDKLKVILRRFKKDYDGWNRDRETPLHFAAKENSYEITTLLIEKARR